MGWNRQLEMVINPNMPKLGSASWWAKAIKG